MTKRYVLLNITLHIYGYNETSVTSEDILAHFYLNVRHFQDFDTPCLSDNLCLGLGWYGDVLVSLHQ